MFQEITTLQSKSKIDQIDLAILDLVDRGTTSLLGLCDAIGKPNKRQFMAARLKRQTERGWICTLPGCNGRERKRILTPTGKKLLKKFRSAYADVVCSTK